MVRIAMAKATFFSELGKLISAISDVSLEIRANRLSSQHFLHDIVRDAIELILGTVALELHDESITKIVYGHLGNG